MSYFILKLLNSYDVKSIAVLAVNGYARVANEWSFDQPRESGKTLPENTERELKMCSYVMILKV